MEYKEFFKITIGKIILTIILFILSLAVFEIEIIPCTLYETEEPCSFNFYIILYLIGSYFISCLLFYIFNKLRLKRLK